VLSLQLADVLLTASWIVSASER